MIGIRHFWNGLNGAGWQAAMAAALVVALSFVSSAARAADTPRLSLKEENGYGRMIFAFQGDVPAYTQKTVAGVLVLSFERPVSVGLKTFSREMPRYVAQAREDAAGKTLRLALTTDFWVNTRVAEHSLYVDLIPPQWAGPAPGLPKDVLARLAAAKKAKQEAEAAKEAAAKAGIDVPTAPDPVLHVRAVHANAMTRLVFDWNQPVLYAMARRGNKVTLTFDRDARVDLAPLRVNRPPYLKDIKAAKHQGKLVVQLTVANKAKVRDFREELSIVLDIEGDHLAAPAADADVETKAPDAALHSHDAADGVATEDDAAAPGHDSGHSRVEQAKLEQGKAEKHSAADRHAGEAVSSRSGDASRLGDMPPKEGERADDGRVAVTLDAGAETSDLIFSWPEEVGAAVFEWAGDLWVVFDRKAEFDLSSLPEDGARIGKWRSIELPQGIAFAAKLNGPMLIGANAEGRDWRISIGETLTSAGGAIPVSRSWQDDGKGVVTLGLASAHRVIRITDPLTRQKAIAVTAEAPVQGVQTPRSFIEFRILQSVQGVGIVPIADDVNVAVAPQSVVVSRKEGLTLSADMSVDRGDRMALADGDADGQAGRSLPGRMDIEAWAKAPAEAGQGFMAGKQYYQDRIARAGFSDVGEAWLDYARYLVGNGLGQEALAALASAAKAEPSSINSASYRALRGAAGVLARHYSEALEDLNGHGLDSDPYAAGWRGAARAGRGEWERARSAFALAGNTVDNTGRDMALDFRIDAAMAGLETGDLDFAKRMVRAMPDPGDDEKDLARTLVVQARLAEAQGQPEDAKILYDQAEETGYPPVQAEARFRLADLKHRSGEMDDKGFAAELEKLRMAWRGGELELSVLRALANIRLRQGNIQAALELMRTVSLNFPHSDAAHVLAGRMSDVFANYFISGGGKEMPPVKALAFYYNFQQLTPVGQKGDEMIRHLADRLVEVDLLPQAAQLLDYQIENRLHGGVAKAQVAARLAGIYLLDQKPKAALHALRETRQVQLPAALQEQRRLLEARTLADLHQYDNALDLLAQMKNRKAALLRCDVLWDSARWPDAGAALEAELGDSWKNDGALDAETRFEVMRAAIAYSMAQDEDGLGRLRKKFGEKMQQSPDASAFAAVSDPIGTGSGGAFRDAVRRIASVNTLDKFLASLGKGTPTDAVLN